jgi:ribosome-binding factor A
MAREYSRAARLADQIQRDLAGLIRLEVKDPRVGLVTVTAVEVSPDLNHARVFVTALADKDGKNETLLALQHAAGFLRSRLSHSLTVRQVPELRFVYDESVERGLRLSKLIDDAVKPDHPGGGD